MATFFESPPFLTHPLPRTPQFSSSSSQTPPPPSNQASQPDFPTPPPQLSTASSEHPATPASVDVQQKPAKPTTVESEDWIASSLTRRFRLDAGLARAAFLDLGVSEPIKIRRIEASQKEENTRNVEKEEEVMLPNGIKYYELKVGGGATPGAGDLVVIDLKGEVEGSGKVSVNTFGGEKKPLALVRECVRGLSMKAGCKRRVIVPPKLGFGKNDADVGNASQIPPFATHEYIVEVEKISIAPA